MLNSVRRLLSSPLARRLRRPTLIGASDVRPLSAEWGFDRGTPIDRYYIEQFLGSHAADVRGRVLEVKSADYTLRFDRGVTRVDVLDIDPRNDRATIVADLTSAESVPSDSFDCFILTQTLQFIYDVRAAVTQAHRILAPGGTLLVTLPVVSRIAPRYGLDGDYWRFTPASCRRLFGDAFGAERVTVTTFGNALAAAAFLRGAAIEDVPRAKLDVHDPHFPVIAAVRAMKGVASA